MTEPGHRTALPGRLVFACFLSWVPIPIAWLMIHSATAHGHDFWHEDIELLVQGVFTGLFGVVTACAGLALAFPDPGDRDRRYARVGVIVNAAALAMVLVPFALGYRL